MNNCSGLRENVGYIMDYRDAVAGNSPQVDCETIEKILKLITSNEDAIESEACIAHGDLNSPLKKALLTGFHSTAKHNATKAVSPSSETMRTI